MQSKEKKEKNERKITALLMGKLQVVVGFKIWNHGYFKINAL